jgi:cell division septum initiation protein DivIVA
MTKRTLTGIDVDKEAAIAELEDLIRALKANEARILELDHSEHAHIETKATESVTIEYALSDEFDGIDPLQYDVDADEWSNL